MDSIDSGKKSSLKSFEKFKLSNRSFSPFLKRKMPHQEKRKTGDENPPPRTAFDVGKNEKSFQKKPLTATTIIPSQLKSSSLHSSFIETSQKWTRNSSPLDGAPKKPPFHNSSSETLKGIVLFQKSGSKIKLKKPESSANGFLNVADESEMPLGKNNETLKRPKEPLSLRIGSLGAIRAKEQSRIGIEKNAAFKMLKLSKMLEDSLGNEGLGSSQRGSSIRKKAMVCLKIVQVFSKFDNSFRLEFKKVHEVLSQMLFCESQPVYQSLAKLVDEETASKRLTYMELVELFRRKGEELFETIKQLESKAQVHAGTLMKMRRMYDAEKKAFQTNLEEKFQKEKAELETMISEMLKNLGEMAQKKTNSDNEMNRLKEALKVQSFENIGQAEVQNLINECKSLLEKNINNEHVISLFLRLGKSTDNQETPQSERRAEREESKAV